MPGMLIHMYFSFPSLWESLKSLKFKELTKRA